MKTIARVDGYLVLVEMVPRTVKADSFVMGAMVGIALMAAIEFLMFVFKL